MIIRQEKPSDYKTVEELTREAFWNLYKPGADEHFALHKLRKEPEFIKDLSFVAEIDNQIVGSIAFSLSIVIDSQSNQHKVITLGPISVLPSMQRKGIGSELVKASIKKAAEMGFKAILLLGSSDYYSRFGFENTHKWRISISDNSYPKSLQALELYQDALDGVSGTYIISKAFDTDKNELEEFDKMFPPKEEYVTVSQKAFEVICALQYNDTVPAGLYKKLNCRNQLF